MAARSITQALVEATQAKVGDMVYHEHQNLTLDEEQRAQCAVFIGGLWDGHLDAVVRAELVIRGKNNYQVEMWGYKAGDFVAAAAEGREVTHLGVVRAEDLQHGSQPPAEPEPQPIEPTHPTPGDQTQPAEPTPGGTPIAADANAESAATDQTQSPETQTQPKAGA